MMLWNNVSPFKSCLFWVAMLVFKGVKQINQPDPIGSLIFMVFMKVNLPWLCMDGMGMSWCLPPFWAEQTKHQLFIGDVPNSKLVGGFTPFEKNMFVKMASSSPKRDENKKYLKPPSRLLKRTWMVTKNGHMNTGILGDVGKYSNIAMFQTGHLEKAVLKRFRTWSWNLGKLTFRCRCSNPMGW